MNQDDDPRDPYVMGQPMRTLSAVIFIAIMFGLPLVVMVYEHFHP